MGFVELIRNVPDFPQPGIMFRDITPLLGDAAALREAIDAMTKPFSGMRIDKVVAIEARGYILGTPAALSLNAGFVPIRKAGKLPAKTFRESYDLEYGSASIEMHQDGLTPGQRVLLIDDVLATGGTLAATAKLVERAGAKVAGICVLIELQALQGRNRLSGYPLESVLRY